MHKTVVKQELYSGFEVLCFIAYAGEDFGDRAEIFFYLVNMKDIADMLAVAQEYVVRFLRVIYLMKMN
ncbi:MAG: hypothetical protein DRN95_02725 [Candidatus Hydrothermarchaeota archaeon]|nr:MAG: hypothetical protein DRN95_02725 [Candidatus Hydrothermarchaeota archaeon]